MRRCRCRSGVSWRNEAPGGRERSEASAGTCSGLRPSWLIRSSRRYSFPLGRGLGREREDVLEPLGER